MNRKRHFLFLALLLAALGLRAQTLVLHHADGTTTDVEQFAHPTRHVINPYIFFDLHDTTK